MHKNSLHQYQSVARRLCHNAAGCHCAFSTHFFPVQNVLGIKLICKTYKPALPYLPEACPGEEQADFAQ